MAGLCQGSNRQIIDSRLKYFLEPQIVCDKIGAKWR